MAECTHLDQIADVDPQTPAGCGECMKIGGTLAAPAPVPVLRRGQLLRLLAQQARDGALPRVGPPAHPVLPARRGLDLVLRRRAHHGARLDALPVGGVASARCGCVPTSLTARRRSATSKGTVAALPACTVAWSESGRFCRSRYQPSAASRSPTAKMSRASGSTAPKAMHRGRRIAAHLQAVDGLDAGPQRQSRIVRGPGQLDVAVVADVHQRGPGRGDRSRRPRPGHGRRGVEPAQPVGGHEQLLAGQLVRPVEDHRDALRRVAVLVDVGRHGSHAGEPEVEGLVEASELGQEGQEEAAHAGVDVAQDAPVQRQRGDVGNGVDHALGIRRAPSPPP